MFLPSQMFSPGFFKESLGHFREWLDQRPLPAYAFSPSGSLLIDFLPGCQSSTTLGSPATTPTS